MTGKFLTSICLMLWGTSNCFAEDFKKWDMFSREMQAKHDLVEMNITVTPIRKDIYLLSGIGGNITLMTGRQGPLLVDSGLITKFDQLHKTIRTLTDKDPRFIINTHWHIDHSGGFQGFNKLGAITIAHKNVRTRLGTDQLVKIRDYAVPAAPPSARPTLTYTDRMSFHWNDEKVSLIHAPRAHTDGDTIIYFATRNIIQLGDIYWSGGYPSIAHGSGGTIQGMIHAVDMALDLADDNTKIIPGHGKITGKKKLIAYRTMLSTVYQRVKALKEQGKTSDQIVKAKPTADLDDVWGHRGHKPDRWIRRVVIDAIP